MQTVADMPSSSVLRTPAAAQRAHIAMKSLPSAGFDAVHHRDAQIGMVARDHLRPEWPEQVALKMVSITVIGNVIHQRIGAGRTALITLPGGNDRPSELRNCPSLIG